MNRLQAALHYLDKGFSVIPIRPDKKPFIQWQDFQKRRATAEEIRAWWTKWPMANVGIVTGEISGIFVIDCDNEEAYNKIQELLPDSFITCIAKTPRGYHLYLIYPKGQNISNATSIIPGVDIRGEGGYIIAPPSVNVEGKVYTWLPGMSIDEVAPTTIPDAILINTSIKG
ncbi:MAG: bifunctional DNA primase/polymerase, partial [Candidatus Paceibacterota bacterium]